MDGIQNLIGRDIRLTLKGKEYRLTEKTLREYAEQEGHICSLKPSPLSLLKDLPPLPDKPTQPVPPDHPGTPEQHRAYQLEREAFNEQERAYFEAVAIRGRMEDRLLKMASRPRVASLTDIDEFDDSLHGWSWRLWRAIRTHHPEFKTALQVRQLIEPIAKGSIEGWQAIMDAVYRAEGFDLLKNSDPPANGGTNSPAESLGQDSSEISASDTADGQSNTSAA